MDLLARDVERVMREESAFQSVDLIIPALPNRRRWRRLRDLPRCVAEDVAGRLGVDCEPRGVVRVRRGPPQKGCPSGAQSRDQVAGAFELRVHVDGRHVMLLDDLIGWGGTMAALTACVRGGNPTQVVGLAFTATRHAPR